MLLIVWNSKWEKQSIGKFLFNWVVKERSETKLSVSEQLIVLPCYRQGPVFVWNR